MLIKLTFFFPADTPTNLGSLQSLNMDTMLHYSFQPEYTVRACSDVLYLKVRRSLYLAAKKASLMERSKKDLISSGEFDEEVEKVSVNVCKFPIHIQYLLQLLNNI